MVNYSRYPLTQLAPVIALLGAALAFVAAAARRSGLAFLGSSLVVVGTLCTAGFALFPFILPSNLDLTSSLTVWDAVSSQKTLGIMLVAASIFVPLILCYTLWGYFKMWGTLNSDHIKANEHGLY